MSRGCFLIIALVLCGCDQLSVSDEAMATRGGAKLGQRFLYGYNCGSCHIIPGIAEATGTVGPPLGGFGSRNYIAGLLVNTPENLVR